MIKIGFLNTCHPDYVFDYTRSSAKRAVDALRQMPDLSLHVIEEPITDSKAMLNAVREFQREDVSALIMFYGSYILPSVPMTLLKEARFPLLIWALPMEERNGDLFTTGSYVAHAMFKGTLDRIGYLHRAVIGFPEENTTREAVYAFIRAAGAAQRLKRMRIGLVGYSAISIYPGNFDHVLLRWCIGPEVEHFDSYQIIASMDQFSEADYAPIRELFRKSADGNCDVPEEMLQKSAQMYLAIKSLCDENELDAITVKCQYEFTKLLGLTPCVPLAQLADQGLIVSCEGDMPCMVSTAILRLLSGHTATYGDAMHHDIQTNVVKLSPCGFLPFSLGAEGTRRIAVSANHKFPGLNCGFTMRPGRVTILRLIEDVGSYRLLYATGEGLETTLRGGIFPALDIRLDGDVQKLADHYAGQHFAICHGDVSREIEALGTILGVQTLGIRA